MRTWHRVIALFILVFALYLGVTGSMIQLIDLRTLYTHAPATDPNMKAIREGLDGTADFQVIGVEDYSAPSLPAGLDYAATLGRVLPAIRAALDGAPLQFVELRIVEGRAVAQAKSEQRLLSFDAYSGAELGEGAAVRAAGGTFGRSQRNTFKGLHRMTAIGNWTLFINVLVGLSLFVMLLSGMVMYFRLLAARTRVGRSGWFWTGGGLWRSLHRTISLLAAVFLLIVAFSGTWLALESLARPFMVERSRLLATQGVPTEDSGAPLADRDLPGMLAISLAAYRAAHSDTPLRVLRLRNYGGMPQAVIVTGETEARQRVFNAVTGQRAGLTEPGYPPQHFPFGWAAHQLAKQIHRGDIIGLPGRWMDLFAGLSLLFLTVSGAFMYFSMWRKRRQAGNSALLWR